MTPMVLVSDPRAVQEAVEVFRSGGCVAVPTDTVYGVAAALEQPVAVRRLFEIKGRAEAKAVAVLVGSIEQASGLGTFDESVLRELSAYWPGPLTVVTQRLSHRNVDLGGDPTSIGIRWAASELLDDLIAEVGPLVTTSANRSGFPTLNTAVEVAEAFSAELDLVIDGGPGAKVASTVIDIRSEHLVVLRAGAISAASLQPLIEQHTGLGSA